MFSNSMLAFKSQDDSSKTSYCCLQNQFCVQQRLAFKVLIDSYKCFEFALKLKHICLSRNNRNIGYSMGDFFNI